MREKASHKLDVAFSCLIPFALVGLDTVALNQTKYCKLNFKK